MKTASTVVLLTVLCLANSIAAISARQSAPQNNGFTQKCSFLADHPLSKIELSEAGKTIEPASVENEKIEQVIIGIDTSGSMRLIVPKIVSHLEAELPNPTVPTMVVVFNEHVDKLNEFTTSKTDLKAALKKVQPSKKSTAVYETIPILQQYAGNHRTHIILITDGYETVPHTIKVSDLLAQSNNLTISYLCWAYGDTKADSGEPMVKDELTTNTDATNNNKEANKSTEKAGKGKRIVELTPDLTLKQIALTTGGDVVKLKNFKDLTSYFSDRLGKDNTLYHLTWRTNNPESPYKVVDPANGQLIRSSSTN